MPGASAKRSVSPSAASPTMRSTQPCGVFSNWRTGRASKNSLATSNVGPSGTSSKRACQAGLKPASAASLQRLQPFVDLDEMQVDRGVEARDAARGAQCVGHQGAAARSQLDEAHRRGRPIASQRSASQAPKSSPNIWEISGAVVKSPAAPTGRAVR